MKIRNIIIAILAIIMCLPVTALAVTGTSNTSTISLQFERPEVVEFRVPTTLDIVMSSDGSTKVSDAKIENLCDTLKLRVTGISLSSDEWDIVEYSDDLQNLEDNTKVIGMRLRGDSTTETGKFNITEGNWDIEAQTDLYLDAKVKIPYQSSNTYNNTKIATLNWEIEVVENEAEPVTILSKSLFRNVMNNNDVTSITFGVVAGENPVPVSVDNKLVATNDGTNWYINNIDGISDIVFPEDITHMFNGLNDLVTVTFGEKVDTHLVKDISYMFYVTENLTSIDLNNLDVSNVESAVKFLSSSGIRSIDVSEWVAPKLKNASEMFSYNYKLETVTLGSLGAPNISDTSGMFMACTTLKNINEMNLDVSNVINMSRMFEGCALLDTSTIDFNSWNTSNVTNMSSVFSGCASMESIDLSNWNTSQVTDMTRMFANSGLTSFSVDSWDTSNVESMKSMFDYCSNLTSLKLQNFSNENLKDTSYFVSSCSKLTSIDLDTFNTPNVTNMEEMFSWCRKLGYLDLSNFDVSNVTNMHSMFLLCSVLSSLEMWETTATKVVDMAGMFSECPKLYTIDISSIDTSSNPDMTDIFEGNIDLEWCMCKTIADRDYIKAQDLGRWPTYFGIAEQ